MTNSNQIYMVWTNWPEDYDLTSLAHTLLKEKLVACINCFAPVTSYYEWEGRLESAKEIPVLMKTSMDRYPALQAKIIELHPYELPEILAVSTSDGLPAYCQWVENSVANT
ncbi:divalent-cation tolerance protein CutA [Leeia sp. TBRC 13508]|uniref:Divalent-cation tolerance protein CutA n=1 Tax=Leeia speluncae TaxID=2884804 RepID=A0ABS8D481_9NEIS|nr:divalent-cation tolerance protein CutA [Leeia speluncae]MCB6182993.1 divalent-cation tolerance protein CutA [Leeia speluncae]